MNIADLRREYSRAALDEASVLADPFEQFRGWFAEAQHAEAHEPNAMTLATADGAGRPSARIVLLKGLDERGFVFFTDYRSRKGIELDANPVAALVFYWAVLERQVRAVGRVERLDAASSFAYFRTRPEGARVGAWASHQSELLPDRATLERRVAQVAAEYAGRDIPLPPHWGGYRLVPEELEFWQGRESRLHDRIQYSRDASQQWQRKRLSP